MRSFSRLQIQVAPDQQNFLNLMAKVEFGATRLMVLDLGRPRAPTYGSWTIQTGQTTVMLTTTTQLSKFHRINRSPILFMETQHSLTQII